MPWNSWALYYLSLLFLPLTFAISYGPHFAPCTNACQNDLRLFCTVQRNAAEQSACWCGTSEAGGFYNQQASNCLQTCNFGQISYAQQRELIERFRGIVCRGSLDGNEDFREFYKEHYGGWKPEATAAAPPAKVDSKTKTTSSADKSKTTSSGSVGNKTVSRTKSIMSVSRITPFIVSPSTTSSSVISTVVTSTTNATFTTPTSSAEPSAEPSDHDMLTTGAIIGISLTGVLVVVSIIMLLAIFWRRRKTNQLAKNNQRLSPPPASMFAPLERRVSVYYSPDDVGQPGAERGAWRNGDAHPGTRVRSITPTVIENEDFVEEEEAIIPREMAEVSNYGLNGQGGVVTVAAAATVAEAREAWYSSDTGSSLGSEWTDYGDEFENVDLGDSNGDVGDTSGSHGYNISIAR
ncbi:hypothetical protein BZA77DRAFT_313875 [Pyronema omphalodes]|nr:hypothetical protein BZA77DRAFT_313875 [Pyronema omphalodes]